MVSVHQVIDHCFQTGLVMGALSRDSLEAAHVTCISSSIVLIGSGKQVSEMRKIGVQDLETDREKEGSISWGGWSRGTASEETGDPTVLSWKT